MSERRGTIVPLGTYVHCFLPSGENFYGIVVGNPRRGVRVHRLNSERRHVLAWRSVTRVSFVEAHGYHPIKSDGSL
jgi:hypothetical protein